MAAAIDVLNFRAVVLDLLRQENPEEMKPDKGDSIRQSGDTLPS